MARGSSRTWSACVVLGVRTTQQSRTSPPRTVAGVPPSIENTSPYDPTVALCLGPHGGPRKWALSHARGTPVVQDDPTSGLHADCTRGESDPSTGEGVVFDLLKVLGSYVRPKAEAHAPTRHLRDRFACDSTCHESVKACVHTLLRSALQRIWFM